MKVRIRSVRAPAESAECASDDAHVRKIQVPVHDVRHLIAGRAPPQLIRDLHDRHKILFGNVAKREPVMEIKIGSPESFFENAGNSRTRSS